MAQPSATYEPRRPAGSVLHQLVQDHLETFLADAAGLRDGEGVPQFVERAFRDYLRCGFLAGGFARFRCGECGLDQLVAFSCKGRALCPSCGGRRMAERAAHLVDHVIPDVHVRQWVLSLPYRVRYRLAWDHDLCRRVTAVFLRAVFRLLQDHARAVGLEQPQGGAVAILQRFGGALNLNVHIHALVLDVLRPPVASERLALTADGQVRLALRQSWADGTTHVLFDPVEFLGRLAVLVPRPRVNLILYYGVLGARAAWRPEVVPRAAPGHEPTSEPGEAARATATPDSARSRARGQCWAALMKRTFPPPPFGLRRGLAVAFARRRVGSMSWIVRSAAAACA